ncbi:SUN domain-containing protein 3-like [Lathamus discolor]|uniref:SUN domain-containing protein 3-like n=1 Tax=Lathamus discolor TaxID=678569 RepID=UPI0032B7711F
MDSQRAFTFIPPSIFTQSAFACSYAKKRASDSLAAKEMLLKGRKMKALKTVPLVLLIRLFLFGESRWNWDLRMAFTTWDCWVKKASRGLQPSSPPTFGIPNSRPAGNDIGEALSRTQTLKEQLQKLQEEFYHLHWSLKDVTERALHEALKQSKLPGFSGSAVQEIINQVVEKLEENQVPMTDYALQSSGAAVIPEYTSPSYRNTAYKISLFSLTVMDYVRSPELILEKENHLGNCWPFHGSQGHVFIKLSVPVIPRAVTLDHVSGPALHGDGISSAPKDFAVYGVTEEQEEQFLGQFVFLAPLNPTQTFQLKNEHSGFVNYILLQVLSNWGHPDYTCIYRFRVHGDPASNEGKVAL